MYNGLNIIVDAFEKEILEYGIRSRIDVDYDSDAYKFTEKELQMFKNFFKYDIPQRVKKCFNRCGWKKKYIMSLKMILKLHKLFWKKKVKMKLVLKEQD